MKRIVIDGNDGVGKSTLVRALLKLGYDVSDRGIPTTMTIHPDVKPRDDELYIILDAPVETSRERLAQAGKDLTEQFHTVEDLTHYRQRFLDVAKVLPNCHVIDATQTAEKVLEECLSTIGKH